MTTDKLLDIVIAQVSRRVLYDANPHLVVVERPLGARVPVLIGEPRGVAVVQGVADVLLVGWVLAVVVGIEAEARGSPVFAQVQHVDVHLALQGTSLTIRKPIVCVPVTVPESRRKT